MPRFQFYRGKFYKPFTFPNDSEGQKKQKKNTKKKKKKKKKTKKKTKKKRKQKKKKEEKQKESQARYPSIFHINANIAMCPPYRNVARIIHNVSNINHPGPSA